VTTDHAGAGLPGDAAVPPELVAASDRRAEHRRRTLRSLGHASTRRRLTSAAIVSALAMLGVGVADAGVQHTLPPTTTTGPTAPGSTSAGSAYGSLRRVALALSADRQALAQLQAATRNALKAGLPIVSAPTPSVGSPAPVSVPAPVAPPAHATTGASGAG
jgi:hypothetical protein